MTNQVSDPIYLDYQATTPVDPRVASVVLTHFTEKFGNASSVDHVFGDNAEEAVEGARQHVADLVGAASNEVIFTSGATEGINLALQGFVARYERTVGRTPSVVVSSVEHRAVLETARALARSRRIVLTELRVHADCSVDLTELQRVAARGLDLICVMAANNEVGTLFPIDEVGIIAASTGANFFCDATQAAGKVPLSVSSSQISLAVLSAHKIYGPMGVGALITRASIDPIAFGGGQQRGLRPGTINVPGVVGLGEACRLRKLEMFADESRIGVLRDRLQARLQEQIEGLVVNGSLEHRLAGNCHVSIPGTPNGAIVAHVRDRLALSTGAACTSGIEEPSHVLRAMGLSVDIQESALRLSLGKFTTEAEIDCAAHILIEGVRKVRSLTRPF